MKKKTKKRKVKAWANIGITTKDLSLSFLDTFCIFKTKAKATEQKRSWQKTVPCKVSYEG